MRYLNKQERDALLDELKGMNFDKAKARLHHIDPKGRLVVYRNNQMVGKWLTRFDLKGLGTRVTLVEEQVTKEDGSKYRPQYELVDVIVEPMPDNRS